MAQKTNRPENKEKLNDLFEKIDSLSDNSAKVLLNFVDVLISKTDELINIDKRNKTNFASNFPPSEDSEIKEIPYKVNFSVQHGLGEKLSEDTNLYMVIQDGLFKAQGLFWTVSTISSVAAARGHKFDSETLANSLDEIGQIGFSIMKDLQTPLESLFDCREVKAND